MVSRARVGGWLAVGVSALLLGVVLFRSVGLNVVNGWTIGAGIAGGLIAVLRHRRPALVAAFVLILVALLPALFGGFGLLYLPSLLLICPLGRRSAVTV